MSKTSIVNYQNALRKRIIELIKFSGLEINGFADLTNISESHMYAILNGTREVTSEVAEKIANPFNLTGSQLLKINFPIKNKLKRTVSLDNFYKKNKSVPSYFVEKHNQDNPSYFIENSLLQTKLFDSPVFVSDVRKACIEAGKIYSSKRVSQVLKYLVEKNKLKSKKTPIKLSNGKLGKRLVDVYYKAKSK